MPNNFSCDSYVTKNINGVEHFKCANAPNGIKACSTKWDYCTRFENCNYCSNKDTELCENCFSNKNGGNINEYF